jgi:hypothetical protein
MTDASALREEAPPPPHRLRFDISAATPPKKVWISMPAIGNLSKRANIVGAKYEQSGSHVDLRCE